MGEGWEYTVLVNNTDSELTVEYIGAKYTLVPNGYGTIRWKYVIPTGTALPLLKFSTGDMELSPVFTNHDLHENRRIVILGDLVNSSSCRMTPRTYPRTNPGYISSLQVDDLLWTMGELEKRVRIWHNQCKHLMKKYQEAVDRVNRASVEFADFWERDLASLFMDSQDPTRVHRLYFPHSLKYFLTSTLQYCILEGEALLRSCGGSSYNQAAFALTSVPPSVPTFSKFALAIRELSWIVDYLCCVIEGKKMSLYIWEGCEERCSWEWCEERCRLVPSGFTNRLDGTKDDSLEADARRQNADREALRSCLDMNLSKSPGPSSFQFLKPATWFVRRTGALVPGELESIWRKRLQASSDCAPGSYSPVDAFVIDLHTAFVQAPGSRSKSGTSKSVQKCKWLGETVALSTMSNVSKVSAQAETGFLARVQHPNVVEWMGYAFKEDPRHLDWYEECLLVTEHMECDLGDLITKRLTGIGGKISKTRPPF